tara:strand:- start:3393 stop:3791 length:399 start_codon:yes stop_codon:yes gene_type:complete
MKFSEVDLPSNKKFGRFFAFIFGLASLYFYANTSISLACSMAFASAAFGVVTIVKADVLLPLNKLWIRFGLLLGMIVSPIVLGVIFFGIFTPIAVLMRMNGRDELRLKFNNKASHWISRNSPIQPESFKHQF